MDLGDGVALPDRFTATFRSGSRIATLHVRVEVPDRRRPEAKVVRVSVDAEHGALTPTDPQQVPWGALYDEAVALGVARLAFVGDVPVNPEWLSDGQVPADVETIARRLQRRRGRRLSPAHLVEVAEVARANPKRRVPAVAETWGVATTTAEYWVKKADEQEGQR